MRGVRAVAATSKDIASASSARHARSREPSDVKVCPCVSVCVCPCVFGSSVCVRFFSSRLGGKHTTLFPRGGRVPSVRFSPRKRPVSRPSLSLYLCLSQEHAGFSPLSPPLTLNPCAVPVAFVWRVFRSFFIAVSARDADHDQRRRKRHRRRW